MVIFWISVVSVAFQFVEYNNGQFFKMSRIITKNYGVIKNLFQMMDYFWYYDFKNFVWYLIWSKDFIYI